MGARCEVLAKVETIFIDDALRHRFAARVVVSGIVKSAVAANMERPAASSAFVAEADPLDDLDSSSAVPAFHKCNRS